MAKRPNRSVKISVICTLRNEASSVEHLLGSLVTQTRKPDEIVICDGGSTDGTPDIIRKKFPSVRVVSKPGSNIAQGRNAAIKAAKHDYIAVIDGGCTADRRWLESIAKHFPDSDAVAGTYLPVHKNEFERLQGLAVCNRPINTLTEENYLPSSRSVAFKRKVWLEIGGYPEGTNLGKIGNCEDTPFDLNLLEKGYRFRLERSALVYWRMRPNWKSLARQFLSYGIGDGKNGIVFKLPKNLIVFFSFAVLTAFSFAWVAYSVLSGKSFFGSFSVPAFLAIAGLAVSGLESLWISKGLKTDTFKLVPFVLVKRLFYLGGVAVGLANYTGYPAYVRGKNF